uniref:Uncharacterized protein n=1 Tax=Glossina palpalis gambiensis TaxID=67801 RepID=A0A1B0BGC4_9MUSC
MAKNNPYYSSIRDKSNMKHAKAEFADMFTKQHISKYPAREERRKAVDELQKQKHRSSSMLSNCTQPTSNVNLTNLAVSLEIAKKSKPFTDRMQLIDLKISALRNGEFTELKSKLEELEVQKCMYIKQQKWTALKEMPLVEALIIDAWSSLPD